MPERTPEQERIRGYLQGQAAKHPIPELQRRIQEGVDALHTTALRFDATTFEQMAPGETWTARDCLSHSVGSNLAVAKQVLYVALTGELPIYEEESISGALPAIPEKHTEGIESLYVHVQDANPEAFLETRWDHPMFGDLNWREWFLFLRIHSFDHQRQLEAMLSGPAANVAER
jgi:hypothetical protein